MRRLLIKASGDVIRKSEFIKDVKEKGEKNILVVICGGGSRVSGILKAVGYDISFDETGSRILSTGPERALAKKILDAEAETLAIRLQHRNIHVIAPILSNGPVFCHINGDELVKKLLSWGGFHLSNAQFEKAYVYTLKERVESKRKIFKDFPEVEVIGI